MACTGLTSIDIPNSVTEIGREAFENCTGLTTINISNSVAKIGEFAFSGCTGITSIDMPNSISCIEHGIFQWCSNLSLVTIPNSVSKVYADAFFGCNLPEENGILYADTWAVGTKKGEFTYALKENTTGIAISAIGEIPLTAIHIPQDVRYIGGGNFSNCPDLMSITVAESNPIFDSRNNCNAIIETSTNTLICGIRNTNIPNTVTNIGEYAFSGCSGLTSVTIPNSVTNIELGAFASCSGLTSIDIPNSVINIGELVFTYCVALDSVCIGRSVQSIGDFAFDRCYNLASIACKNPVPPTCTSKMLRNNNPTGTFICDLLNIYVPKESVTLYEADAAWKSHPSKINIIGVDFEEDATNIDETIQESPIENNAIYDINGRRTNKQNHGIYIKNGRKILAK